MNRLFSFMILCTLSLSIAAQTIVKPKAKPFVPKQKTTTKKVGAPNKFNEVSGFTTKDRIEQRLKDSVASNANNPTATSSTTTINGIIVASSAVSGSAQSNASQSKAAQSNATQVNAAETQMNVLSRVSAGDSITRLGNANFSNPNNVTVNGGAYLQSSSTNPINNSTNSTTGSKPVSCEQSQYNTTDLNRNQVNNINQNQNASSTQNNNNAITNSNQNTQGQTQLGQNQAGENIWSPPPSIISSGFGRDYPAIRNANWTVDNNKNYIARYKNGDWWNTTSYNNAGLRIETRTEIPLSGTLPSAVIIYKGNQNLPVELSRISKIDRPGKPELYEVRFNTGKVLYLNSQGIETTF